MVILSILDTILFVLMAISVGYLFVFALFSLGNPKDKYARTTKRFRFAVLIPAYKDDAVIEKTVAAVLAQNYLADRVTVVVISDHMGEEVNSRLAKLPIVLLKPKFEKSSKAKALNFAVDHLEKLAAETGNKYDVVTILDSDNLVEPEYLQDLADAYDLGMTAIQAHRVAKNRNTSTAILDATSEEINNSIFRKGHVALGVSSALIGSGMAFDYKWFAENIRNASTAGEDKELEVMLLKQRIFIDYLDYTLVYDEKVSQSAVFYNQRRRWLAAQFSILGTSLRELPEAILSGNMDYCDKLFQWMMLPRVILMGLTGLMAVCVPFVALGWAVKWWILLLVLLFALAFAVPNYLVDKNFKKAITQVPLLGFMMVINLFRMRGVNKNFIHTKKEVV